MIGAIKDRFEKFLGRGRHSIAVPVMDGPLHPNNALEEAELLFNVDGLDNLTDVNGEIWCSSEGNLMRVTDGQAETVDTYDTPITFLAASPDGGLAVGLDGKGFVIRGGAHDETKVETLGGAPLMCPTAAAFEDGNSLVLTVGAKNRPHADWKVDLMNFGKTGEVWRIALPSGEGKKLVDGLAYPYGICPTQHGLAVSEAWAHRVIIVEERIAPKVVLKDLPSYPSRIVPGPGGDLVLTLFAPRNQLVEFVLREPEFLRAMTEQVHPNHWIAPKLMWGEGFKEPMQGAALKTMGIIKPWAPTWSYGLVVTLDGDFNPTASFHSRADGTRHGVTSATMHGDKILVGSKGSGDAVLITPAQISEAH